MRTITVQLTKNSAKADVIIGEELLQGSREELMDAISDAIMLLQNALLDYDVSEADS